MGNLFKYSLLNRPLIFYSILNKITTKHNIHIQPTQPIQPLAWHFPYKSLDQPFEPIQPTAHINTARYDHTNAFFTYNLLPSHYIVRNNAKLNLRLLYTNSSSCLSAPQSDPSQWKHTFLLWSLLSQSLCKLTVFITSQ